MSEHLPNSITPDMLSRFEHTGQAIGRAEAAGIHRDRELPLTNRIRAIHGSHTTEGNRLSDAQRNLSTTLRHRRLRFTEQSLLLWMWQVG